MERSIYGVLLFVAQRLGWATFEARRAGSQLPANAPGVLRREI